VPLLINPTLPYPVEGPLLKFRAAVFTTPVLIAEVVVWLGVVVEVELAF
jgi:hypothetical protein